MTWKEILERLKSPVVLIQILSLISAALVVAIPDAADWIKWGWSIVVGIWNIVSGLNNPTNKKGF